MPPKSKSELPKCRGCNSFIRTVSDAKLHPLLLVLVCKACLKAYGSGDFSKFPDGVDENGVDNFCRVCVDGGDLFCCDGSKTRCTYTFCRDCIRRIHPQDPILNRDNNNQSREEADKWTCLVCDSSKTDKARREALINIERLGKREAKKNAATDHNYANPIANKKRKPKQPSITKSRVMQQLRLTPAKEKSSKSSKVAEVVVQRDPEATSMPQLEIPKQPKTSLRNLSAPRVSFSQALATSTPIRRDKPLTSTKSNIVMHRTQLAQPQSILRSKPQKRVSIGREGIETSLLIAENELRDRLKEFMIVKDFHLKKVNTQFSDIAEHFFTLDPKEGSQLMREHIGSMRRSIQEINNMFINLETIWTARQRE